MHFGPQKSPQVGDVSPAVGDLPHQEVFGEDKEVLMKNLEKRSEILSYQTDISSADVSSQQHSNSANTASSAPSRTHFRSSSSSRRLLHRCPFGNCCNKNRTSTAAGVGAHFSRGSHRGSGSGSSMTYTNIPFDKQDGTQTWPLRNASSHPNKASIYYSHYHQGHHHNIHHHHSHNLHHHNSYNHERWQVPYNNPSVHKTSSHNPGATVPTPATISTTPRELLVRGIQNTTPAEIQQLQQLQQLQQQQPFQIQPHDRKRAINYMMTHLQVRGSGSDDSAALVAVRQRIERLESQVYHSVKTKEEYVHHLASKLIAIMDKLYSCNTSRLKHSHHSTVHSQPACV